MTSALHSSALLCVLVLSAARDPISTLTDRGASRGARMQAAKALASSKDPRAIDVLIKQLSIRDEEIVEALERSLRSLHAVPVLQKRLSDSDASEEQKVLACTGLRVLKEKSSVAPLIHALKDESPRVRKEAALALGVIAPADAEGPLLAALTDPDADVRYFAADALGDVRTPAVKQAIAARLEAETDAVVRASLLNARNKLDRPAGE